MEVLLELHVKPNGFCQADEAACKLGGGCSQAAGGGQLPLREMEGGQRNRKVKYGEHFGPSRPRNRTRGAKGPGAVCGQRGGVVLQPGQEACIGERTRGPNCPLRTQDHFVLLSPRP